MAYQSLTIIDDFYDDYEAVRKIALSLDYSPRPGTHYTGRQAIAPGYKWESVRSALRQFITEPVDGPCTKDPPHIHGKFRVELASDPPAPLHQDQHPWSGIVYLTRPEDCLGRPALGFYRHKSTGATSWSPEWDEEVFGHLKDLSHEAQEEEVRKYMADASNWEAIQVIEQVTNRAIVLNAQCFHAGLGRCGDRIENARLTQHFEWYDLPESAPS